MGYALTILAFLGWAFAATVLLRAVPLPGPTAACLGFAIGAAVLLPLAAIRERGSLTTYLAVAKRHPYRVIAQIFAYAGTVMTYHWAIKLTTVANASLTHSSQPIFTCLVLLPLFRRQRPTGRELASVLIGLLGLFVLFAPQLSLSGMTGDSWFGVVLGLLSAVCYAVSIMQLGFLLPKIPTVAFLAMNLAFSSLLILPFALHAGGAMPDASGLAALLGYGVLSFVVANLIYLAASKRMPESHLAVIGYAEPVVAIVMAALWLRESLTLATLAGALLIVASGLIIGLGRRRPPPPATVEA